MSHDIFLTSAGKAKLLEELEELTGPKRRAVVEAIREARSHGDLKENAAYHEAKLNQSRLESRINEINHILDIGRSIERPADMVGAHLGSLVTYVDLDSGKETTVTLVGQFEANPREGLLSIESPVGSGLIGKQAGDRIQVQVPAGTRNYEVQSVEYKAD